MLGPGESRNELERAQGPFCPRRACRRACCAEIGLRASQKTCVKKLATAPQTFEIPLRDITRLLACECPVEGEPQMRSSRQGAVLVAGLSKSY